MRRNGTLFLLILLAGGLAVYLYRTAPPRAVGGEPLLPAASLGQTPDGGRPPSVILALTLRGPGGHSAFSLRRDEGPRGPLWHLHGDGLRERANDAAGEEMLAALREARVLRRLPGALRAAQHYGLDEGRWRARLSLPGGRTLRIGDDAPGEAVYGAWEGEGDVLLLPQDIAAQLLAGRDGLRRRSLLLQDLTTEPDEIALGPVTLRRRPSSWEVREGERRSRARIEEVKAILVHLGAAAPVRMLEGVGLPYRGDHPMMRAPVLLRSGEVVDAPWVLRVDGVDQLFFGPPCPEQRGEVYAVRADGARMCLSAEDAARLRPGFGALRELRLVPFAPREVQRLRVAGAELLRQQGRWLLDGRPADGGAVLDFLDALGALAGTAPPPGAQVKERGAALLLETAAGDQVTLTAGSCAGPCVQRDEEEPLAVAADALPLLGAGPLRFLPRTLVAAPPAGAAAVTLERRAGPAEEARHKDGQWLLVRPVAAPADAVHVGRLLSLLSDLRVERWAAREPRPEHGLGALRLSVTAAGARQPLQLGAAIASGGGCYASVDGQGPVGVLTAEVCAALQRPLVSRDLLLLDEVRLREVTLLEPRAGRRVRLARLGRRYTVDGRELDAAPCLQALRALGSAEPAGYGPAGTAPPLLHLIVRHEPMALPAPPGPGVAPEQQELALYSGRDAYTARLLGRDVSYRVAADLKPLLRLLSR